MTDILKSRLLELAQTSYKQNRYTFSQFLAPVELIALDELARELKYMDYDVFGGHESCERQMSGTLSSFAIILRLRVISLIS